MGIGGPGDINADTTDLNAGDQTTQPLIHDIAKWYSETFNTNLATIDIMYSRTLEAFVHVPKNNAWIPQGPSLDLEEHTNHLELRALCTLVGPYGVRVIDRAILKNVAEHAHKIKKIIVEKKGILETLSVAYTKRDTWVNARDQLMQQGPQGQPNDLEVLVHLAIVMGCALKLRQLLKAALKSVSKVQIPVLFEATQLAAQYAHMKLPCDPNNAELDQLASDMGIDMGEADHELRSALEPAIERNVAWNLLPAIFGISFTSQGWQDARFSVEYDGHTNNVHCIVYAIQALICSECYLRYEPAEAAQEIVRKYEEFTKYCCYSLQHMHSLHHEQPAYAQQSADGIGHMMIFLEQFVSLSNGKVTLLQLEKYFPYTILRTNYIEIYQLTDNPFETVDEDADEAPPAQDTTAGRSSLSKR